MRAVTFWSAIFVALCACLPMEAQTVPPSPVESASLALPDSPNLPDAPGMNGTIVPPNPALCVGAPTEGGGSPEAESAADVREPCPKKTPYTRFLDTPPPSPMTPQQKAHQAFHNLKDPGNLATIVGTAAFTIGTESHTAYGPGWKGFGKNTGYSLLQDTTGEFFGTFLIPTLAHEDPHYHRMPYASVPRRILHAFARTVIAQHDDGSVMPNYANLLTNPICAEISNLYVPGVRGNGPSTAARILIGYATDPEDTLITEFLPDVAKHIHIHVIFVQRILNPVGADQYPLQ